MTDSLQMANGINRNVPIDNKTHQKHIKRTTLNEPHQQRTDHHRHSSHLNIVSKQNPSSAPQLKI